VNQKYNPCLDELTGWWRSPSVTVDRFMITDQENAVQEKSRMW
jgi:hypothetical protein